MYRFASDRSGQQQFSTKSTDANGKQSEQFTDGRGRVTSVKQYTSEGDVWTSFTYNALGEQLEAINDKGHKTVSQYDWLGRRTSRVHPDAGLSTYAYDLAGNLTGLCKRRICKRRENLSLTPTSTNGSLTSLILRTRRTTCITATEKPGQVTTGQAG